ncbi:hypothetical protein J437_LFUL017062 [Ladona fulva]|uniref:Innexin n=1 Tax=Ladona fulva TaxID=123851 RepID=A0A8K0KLJ9_LADFU|nr:hypothetical protein J437_LFUL017062 [Ladona fulva]
MDKVAKGISVLLALEDVTVNNFVFRLHYKATVIMLLVFALVVTSKEHIGDPIECFTGKDHLEVIDKYCWIHSTYTVREEVQDVGSLSMNSLKEHPGVGMIPINSSYSIPFEEKIKRHKYYQWVSFFLLFQALLFFIPHYIWDRWEGGRLKSLVLELSHPTVDLTETASNQGSAIKVIQSIIQYWEHHLHYHDGYGFVYAICEFLNLVNAISQFYFLNFMVGGDLHAYIESIFKSSEENIQNVVERIFPKVAKCQFEYFGHSGSKVIVDALCVLPLNILNEKIFAILWLWFIAVSILSGFAVLYRVMCYFNYKLRLFLILSQTRSISECRVREVVRNMHYGDWFILYLMAKNMNHLALEKLLLLLSENFAPRQPTVRA